MEDRKTFDVLNDLNINGHTELKKVEGKELTYLSWPWAWAEVKKRYPDAHYTIWKNADGLPYTEDEQTGYMVYTTVTIEGITHEMWLPVMNGANRAMKRHPYKYATKYGEKSVEAATMMDINKAIMRCLVKNLAMFGLGLYIYAGEDLPEVEKDDAQDLPKAVTSPPQRKGPVQPQNVANTASMTKAATIPQEAAEAPQTGPVGPEPGQNETPGAYIKRRIVEIGRKSKTFDFMTARAALIEGGVIEDIPSATMNMKQARALMDAIEANSMKAG